jgi:hypothetical protein
MFPNASSRISASDVNMLSQSDNLRSFNAATRRERRNLCILKIHHILDMDAVVDISVLDAETRAVVWVEPKFCAFEAELVELGRPSPLVRTFHLAVLRSSNP